MGTNDDDSLRCWMVEKLRRRSASQFRTRPNQRRFPPAERSATKCSLREFFSKHIRTRNLSHAHVKKPARSVVPKKVLAYCSNCTVYFLKMNCFLMQKNTELYRREKRKGVVIGNIESSFDTKLNCFASCSLLRSCGSSRPNRSSCSLHSWTSRTAGCVEACYWLVLAR